MSVTKNKITVQDLIKMGLPITPGDKYIPKEWIPKKAPSLVEIRRRLSKIKESLAETVARMRDEE